jgi:hypothetical protein
MQARKSINCSEKVIDGYRKATVFHGPWMEWLLCLCFPQAESLMLQGLQLIHESAGI